MSRFNFSAIPQHASNVHFQPLQQQQHQQNNDSYSSKPNYNAQPQKSLQARRQEQQKSEEAENRRMMKEEITKLANLTKAQLRKYFQEQIDDKEDVD